MNSKFFMEAKPIWIENKSKNIHIKLQTTIKKRGADLIKIATSGLYQLFINGEFVASGPVRSGRGYFRVDYIKISDKLIYDSNIIDVICVHYGIPCYGLMLQEPFITCEIEEKGAVVCSTAGRGFSVSFCRNYIQKVSKYSLQRGFSESYLVGKTEDEPVKYVLCQDKNYIDRIVPYSDYERRGVKFVSKGSCSFEKPVCYETERWVNKQFENEADDKVYEDLKSLKYSKIMEKEQDVALLEKGDFVIGKIDKEVTGCISFDCECYEEAVLYVTYDEMLTDRYVNPLRNHCIKGIKYYISPGKHKIINFEPGSMKYVCFSLITGKMSVKNVEIIEYKHKPVKHKENIPDKELKKIYDAAVETFRQNSFDIYTDCPSRERAGWLCDSFFTGRAEAFLCGENLVEKAFLENFLMEDKFENIPEGMFPMCYPADHPTGKYIPNWAMWLMLELEEYYNRTKDAGLLKRYKEKAYKLLEFFKKYENADGLLEKLDEWVFVDWSESGEYVQDVNFPTNMLYAYMLEKISALYFDDNLKDKSEKIKEKIRKLSYNGEFFCDNLIIEDRTYVNPGVTTEACQYYAFFTGTATKDTHPDLWNKLLKEFGPERIKNGLYPNVPPSNAFIGNYLRLEVLSRNQCWNKLLREIRGYFAYMADTTGTLWEKVDDTASLNHGFAAQVAVWICEAIKALNDK